MAIPNNIESKLWMEQFNAMEKSFKLQERKIIFVIALFGIGGYGIFDTNLKDFIYLSILFSATSSNRL